MCRSVPLDPSGLCLGLQLRAPASLLASRVEMWHCFKKLGFAYAESKGQYKMETSTIVRYGDFYIHTHEMTTSGYNPYKVNCTL